MIATRTSPFAAAAVAALVLAPLAHAEPDPHMPNANGNYCPGGGMGVMNYLSYCDGEHYPDGSYWHQVQYGAGMIGHPNGLFMPSEPQCMLDNAPAPPGGCGGAVQ